MTEKGGAFIQYHYFTEDRGALSRGIVRRSAAMTAKPALCLAAGAGFIQSHIVDILQKILQ